MEDKIVREIREQLACAKILMKGGYKRDNFMVSGFIDKASSWLLLLNKVSDNLYTIDSSYKLVLVD